MFLLHASAFRLFTTVLSPYAVLLVLWYFVFQNFSSGSNSSVLPLLTYIALSVSMMLYLSWQFHAFKYFVRFSRISHVLRRIFGLSLFINGLIFFIISSGALIATSPAQGFGQYSVSPLVKETTLFLTMITSLILAKVIVTAEQRHSAAIDQYFGTALMILFFPLGVWKIQSRISRIKSQTRRAA